MKKLIVLTLISILLSACVVSPRQAAPLTAQQVLDRFKAAGLTVGDVRPRERDPQVPLPNSWKECLRFSIPEIAPDGGQVFTCATKRDCDALFAYFDMLKGLAGPYTYQSRNGLIVLQLNSGLTPEQAAKFAKVLSETP